MHPRHPLRPADLADNLARLGIAGNGAQRYTHDDILCVLTRRAGTRTALTIFGEDMSLIFKVNECPILAVALQDDAATLTAITAIGTTEGDEFFTTEVSRSCTTVSRTGKYLDVIHKVRRSHNAEYVFI